MGAAVERFPWSLVMRTLRRIAVASFLLYLVAAPGGAFAAGARGARHSPRSAEGPVTTLLLQAWDALSRLWTKNGCGADPDGRCAPAPTSTSTLDNGCSVDPSGRCAPAPTSTSTLDNGCGADPSGHCGS